MCLGGCAGRMGHYTDPAHEARDKKLFNLAHFYAALIPHMERARKQGYSFKAIKDFVDNERRLYDLRYS